MRVEIISKRRAAAINMKSPKNIIGLTGGMGCGKSTISGFLNNMGFPIIDADLLTRRVHRDPVVCRKILECFGAQTIVDTPDGPVVQRGELAKIAFSCEESRRMLNQIMQPALYAEAKNAIERVSKPCILDAPLLFEVRWDELTDWNVVVLCPLEVRIERIQARDQLPERQILARIQAQMTDELRCRRADSIIYNTSTLECLRRQTESIFSNI